MEWSNEPQHRPGPHIGTSARESSDISFTGYLASRKQTRDFSFFFLKRSLLPEQMGQRFAVREPLRFPVGTHKSSPQQRGKGLLLDTFAAPHMQLRRQRSGSPQVYPGLASSNLRLSSEGCS